MERAVWVDWGDLTGATGTERAYVGDEADERALPTPDDAVRALDLAAAVTLVTPPVSQCGLERALAVADAMASVGSRLEVVCNDWGMLRAVAANARLIPVVGRLLARQATDPRLGVLDDGAWQARFERDVPHADGTLVRLRHRPPTPDLRRLLRTCALDAPVTLEWLARLRVSRLEVGNVLQGLELTLRPGFTATLHMPEVLVAVARDPWPGGPGGRCHPSLPVVLHRHGSGIYYRNDRLPTNLATLPVDRLVVRRRASSMTVQ